MKARFMTKTALSALALAFAGALPGVAQQTASPAAVPAVNKVKASAVEKAFMNQMAGVVQASLKAGALDMKAVTEILNAAVKAGVSDQVMGSLVSMAAGAFPGSAPAVASAAVKSYGTQVTEANVRNVIASAVAVRVRFSHLGSGYESSGQLHGSQCRSRHCRGRGGPDA